MIRIAFLNKYQNKVNRGAETFVAELSKRLSKNNEVDILSDINYLDLIKNRYDIVVPTNGRAQAFFVRIITWITRSKMVISGQSGAGLDDRLNLYSQPDIFVGLTKHQSNWAKKINPLVKIETIPNGVDLKQFTINNSQFKNKVNIVLSVGAFTKEKRHDLTINAVSKLNNTKLIIIGSGGDLKDEIYESGIKILGEECFEILSVNHKEMPKFYKFANVLAFPTVPWESFGIALVEAMASGLPVVVTNDPIRREIVGNAGILVDPENIDEYANALQKAMDINWGDKPRKQAEKFSWDKIAKQYEDLFRILIQK